MGVAFGKASDITAEAAGAVVLDSSFRKLDELFHVGRRLRRVALQTAVGGMTASVGCMLLAACGGLTPVEGALTQELIDVLAVLNAPARRVRPAQSLRFQFLINCRRFRFSRTTKVFRQIRLGRVGRPDRRISGDLFVSQD